MSSAGAGMGPAIFPLAPLFRSVAFTPFPGVAIADPAAMPHVMPEGWSTGPHHAATAHDLAAGLMIRGPQAATAARYDNDRGACLAAIVAVFGNLVRDAVATGWRVLLAERELRGRGSVLRFGTAAEDWPSLPRRIPG